MKLIKQFKGDVKHEYAVLEDYITKLKKSNKGSIVELEREDDNNVF